MSDSPYAGDQGEWSAPGHTTTNGAPLDRRASLLAVFSLVFSLLCCLPGFGVIGMALGAGGLRAIKRSEGRLGGRPAAMGGIIVGLMVTALQVAVAFGLAQAYTFWFKQMTPAPAEMLLAVEAGDIGAARSRLSPDADGDLTDVELVAFLDALKGAYGAPVGPPADMSTAVEAWRVYLEVVQSASANAQTTTGADAPMPVTVVFANGAVSTIVVFDDAALGQTPQRVLIADMLASLPDGTHVVLRRDGPAKALADALGLTLTAPALPPAPASPPIP